MKNYYEILEISNNASQEIIEKVYKVLAKKYHPDLNPDNVKEAEEKFKEISEAYEILSSPSERQKYDEELARELAREFAKKLAEEQKIKQEAELKKQKSYYDSQIQKQNYDANNSYKNTNSNIKRNNIKNNVENNIENNIENFADENFADETTVASQYNNEKYQKQLREYQRQMQEYEIQKAYNDAYVDALKSMGVKVVYKKTFKDYLRIILFIFILIVIGIILWQIPYIRNSIMDFYNQSGILKNIIDTIINIVVAIYESIKNLIIKNQT